MEEETTLNNDPESIEPEVLEKLFEGLAC